MRPFYVFVHVPKTAGTSVRVAAASHFGAQRMLYDYGPEARQTSALVLEWVYEKRDLQGFRQAAATGGYQFLSGHFPLSKYRASFDDAHFLSWMRHPVDRVWSAYRHFHTKLGFDGSFSDFYTQPQQCNRQVRMLGENLDSIDFVGITERFHRSLLVLSAQFGLTLKQVRANRDREGAALGPSEEEREAVLALNQADLDLYRRAEQRLLEAPFSKSRLRLPGLLRRLLGG
jgi:hypothetical protein